MRGTVNRSTQVSQLRQNQDVQLSPIQHTQHQMHHRSQLTPVAKTRRSHTVQNHRRNNNNSKGIRRNSPVSQQRRLRAQHNHTIQQIRSTQNRNRTTVTRSHRLKLNVHHDRGPPTPSLIRISQIRNRRRNHINHTKAHQNTNSRSTHSSPQKGLIRQQHPTKYHQGLKISPIQHRSLTVHNHPTPRKSTTRTTQTQSLRNMRKLTQYRRTNQRSHRTTRPKLLHQRKLSNFRVRVRSTRNIIHPTRRTGPIIVARRRLPISLRILSHTKPSRPAVNPTSAIRSSRIKPKPKHHSSSHINGQAQRRITSNISPPISSSHTIHIRHRYLQLHAIQRNRMITRYHSNYQAQNIFKSQRIQQDRRVTNQQIRSLRFRAITIERTRQSMSTGQAIRRKRTRRSTQIPHR